MTRAMQNDPDRIFFVTKLVWKTRSGSRITACDDNAINQSTVIHDHAIMSVLNVRPLLNHNVSLVRTHSVRQFSIDADAHIKRE